MTVLLVNCEACIIRTRISASDTKCSTQLKRTQNFVEKGGVVKEGEEILCGIKSDYRARKWEFLQILKDSRPWGKIKGNFTSSRIELWFCFKKLSNFYHRCHDFHLKA